MYLMPYPRFLRSFCEAVLGFDPADPPHIRQHRRALSRFYDDAFRRGLSCAEMSQELTVRTALAQIRRRASDWTLQEPYSASRAIQVVCEDVQRTLSKQDAKVLADTVAQLSWRDLLYPDAWKAAEKSIRDEAWLWRRKPPSIDEIAALRVRQ
jgi:hypothetical protein